MPGPRRKVDDADILMLNSIGLSLREIASRLGCHHTTVTLRLKEMGVPPVDTRHAFMEEIFKGLSLPQQTWLLNQLAGGRTIKDFVKNLLVKEYANKPR